MEGKALDLCRAEAGWKFIPNTGKGAVSVGKSSDGKDAVFIDWDFAVEIQVHSVCHDLGAAQRR